MILHISRIKKFNRDANFSLTVQDRTVFFHDFNQSLTSASSNEECACMPTCVRK